MARRSSRAEPRAARKPRGAERRDAAEKLDWSQFNLLENLLVFCAVPTRSVPQESGVCFQIASKVKEDGVCVLFHIDRGPDSLLGADAIRPDYLVVHATRDECICTIVEMKGTHGKEGEHGIEQMKVLRDRLRKEIGEHLPSRCKVHFQGILLTPFNAQVPLPQITREASAGFTILPLQYNERAELYPYIRTRNELGAAKGRAARYEHQRLPRHAPELNPIEDLLVRGAQRKRIEDEFHVACGQPRTAKGRTGIYLNYARPGEKPDEYAALATTKKEAVLAFRRGKNGSTKLRQQVEEELDRLGLRYRALRVTEIPETKPSRDDDVS